MNRNRPRSGNATLTILILATIISGCATHQGYQGAHLGAFTGSAAGALIDDSNPWRGAVIGGGLGAVLGGTLTDRPYYPSPYPDRYGYHYSPRRYYQNPYYIQRRNEATRGATVGGLTGAAAGALIDHDNRWRGSIIGGILGSIFGGGIGAINAGPSIPVLQP